MLFIAAGVPYAESALLLGQRLPGAGYVHAENLVAHLRPHAQALEAKVLAARVGGLILPPVSWTTRSSTMPRPLKSDKSRPKPHSPVQAQKPRPAKKRGPVTIDDEVASGEKDSPTNAAPIIN